MKNYDIIVVGAGHAGVEAALAAARHGLKTALFTTYLDNIAMMSYKGTSLSDYTGSSR